MKEEKEKEKSENDRKVKELEEKRSRKKSLDAVVDDSIISVEEKDTEVVEDIKKDNESQIAEVNNENLDYWNKVSQENKDNE